MIDFSLRPEQNVWKKVSCDRGRFLIDAAQYYEAFYETCLKAERTIYILGWDIDSRTILKPRSNSQYETLGAFLNRLLLNSHELEIYILGWDYSVIYALEREILPQMKTAWNAHERMNFHLDDAHPLGGSHHQKVVVVDDEIAFVGGLDLCQRRWDTSEHLAENPARCDHEGLHYGPFHDIQMMVEGDVALSLGDLCRERWLRFSGMNLKKHEHSSLAKSKWPENMKPDFTNCEVGIAREFPANGERPPIYEVEQLYLDSIRSAARYIYLENQYFTSITLARALASRLREPEGPEIILVLPERAGGWLEVNTMGLLSARALVLLQRADHFNRLRIYYPHIPELGDKYLTVHAKITIIDDEFVRVGSSNLNQRSLRVDSECDLCLYSEGQEHLRPAIETFRDRLLSEHLNVEPAVFSQTYHSTASMILTIEALQKDRARSLVDFEVRTPRWYKPNLHWWLARAPLVDPFVPKMSVTGELTHESSEVVQTRWQLWAVLLVVIAISLLWRSEIARDLFSPRILAAYMDLYRGQIWTPAVVALFFVLGSLVLFPVTFMIVATTLAFSPIEGFIYALFGSLCAAIVTYNIGRLFGRRVLPRVSSQWVMDITRRLNQGGAFSVAILRLIPVAPFTFVNIVAGASGIGIRAYIVGTLLGMGFGIFWTSIIAGTIKHTVQNPDWHGVLVLLFLIVLVVGFNQLLKRKYVNNLM